jgi:energy-coupling factor transporter ATP-binding protein EcfA2
MFDLDFKTLLKNVSAINPEIGFDKHIAYAVFPNFKNLEPGARINFEFPITALTGANGTGKSSILHALWGMPARRSTSRFWFSTALDPIEEGGQHGIQRYFYSHWVSEIKKHVETIKNRGKKRMGYWEPSRLKVSDGMKKMPAINTADTPYRSEDRWNPVEREVIYLNLKCELGGFDRLFYFPPRIESQEKRQERFLKAAHKLRRVIDGNLQSYKPGGAQALFENRSLTEEELKWISYILGKQYLTAKLVMHRFYGGTEAPSVLFENSNLKYSEAFAGSGELAVVRMVVQILASSKNALILLDEPETSLHPGAQERLIGFLLQMVLTKRLQIVISTHSPSIVNLLPTKAIKVLEETASGRNVILPVSHPNVAFNRLGHTAHEKILLVVEDILLFSLVEMALKSLDEGERNSFQVFVPPGGANSILTHLIPQFIFEERNAFIILDGDKKPATLLPDKQHTTPADFSKAIKNILKEMETRPLHMADEVEQEKYLQWVSKRVGYLDATCPEQVVLEALAPGKASQWQALTNQQAKSNLVKEMLASDFAVQMQEINTAAKFIIKPENTIIVSLKEALLGFIQTAQS